MRVGIFKNVCFGLSLLLLTSTLMSCGAKHKKASDVAHIFSNPALTLQQKMLSVCHQMIQTTPGPKLNEINFARDACNNPGDRAQNLSTSKEFYFTAISSDGENFSSENPDATQKDKILKLRTRSQIWMNRSIVNVAGAVLTFIREGKQNPQQKEVLTIQKLTEPQFDKDLLYFLADIQAISTSKQNGSININNKVRVEGRKFDNSFAVSVRSTESSPFERSLFKDVRILVFVIPHANDIYIDILIDIDVHSVSLDKVVKEEIIKTLSKTIDDLLKRVFK